jgi:hypothetical protein
MWEDAMTERVPPDEAARALDEIRRRQAQVIDVATIPTWYWWAIGALMVGFAVAVDTRRPAAIGVGVSVFVVAVLALTLRVVTSALRTQLRNDLIGARGVLAILGFVGLVVGVTLAVAFSLRAAGLPYPATVADAVGGVLLGLGGPRLMRALRRIMLANRAGSTR